ncbi:hypothetical protein [Lutibacter citreus]|uniref:hypothetical protein n=1 Tax=Lutibacter citreus TaxID=2138210 RepID=UPI000DBE2F49|nr:hypothetical protein [Lutibacter citreus]
MKHKLKEQEVADRSRPAMVKSTRSRGVLYRKISNLLMIFFFIFLINSTSLIPFFNVQNPLYDLVPIPKPLFILLAILSVLGVIILRKKARRHKSPRFVKLESAPGVLFLRPFSEDTDWKVYYSWGRDRRPTAFLELLKVQKFELKLWLRGLRRQENYEFGEILSELTLSFGNIAAIGEPGSPPIIGADNVYVSDDNWKEEVLQMARNANLVILTVGITPGVIWETENMIRLIPPSRLLLNIPGGTPSKRRKNYAEFQSVAGDLFPAGLPKKLKTRAISFKEDWSTIEDTKRQPLVGSSAHVAWWMSRVLP